MEAFSFGIPTIATNVGGVHEIVSNANGFLLEANPSPLDIWKTIEAYYYLPESEKAALKENAYNTWGEKYNAKTNYIRFAEQYLN
jgi:glycosyltransferase involved in cell wall biosynthesis